jgi:hypothetical protein
MSACSSSRSLSLAIVDANLPRGWLTATESIMLL